MDHNPFQQPNQHPHNGHHESYHPHHQPHQQQQHHQEVHNQSYQQPYQEQAPPPPPPIPAFNQNFVSAQQSFAPASPALPQQQPTPQPPQYQVAPPAPIAPLQPPLAPQPVINVLSPRGIEYVFQTLALLTGALGLLIVLLSLVNGQTGFDVLGFPVAMLLVSLPIFSWLFLRLKNAELRHPELRLDASKRRSTQFVQIVTFLTCLFSTITLVALVFAKIAGSYDGSIFKVFLNVFMILLIAGGILAYYWRDEHNS